MTHAFLILKLARPRTWCFIVTMFIFGYASTGVAAAGPMLVGIVVFSVMTAVSNLFNAWTGQVEDRINLPHRQVWLERIGASAMRATILGCYAVLVTLPWLVSPLFALITVIGALISILYSWGPTLKAHPLFSLVSFATGVAVPFVAGWTIARPLTEISPVLFVVSYFFFAYGTLKNIPDIEGDRAAGVDTLFTLFSLDRALALAGALLLSPYVLLVGLVIGGVLDLRYLILLAFAPIVFLILAKTRAGHSKEQREATHALGYFYQLTFFLALLLLYWPTLFTMIAAAVVLSVGVAADRFRIDSRPYNLRLTDLFRVNP